MRKKLSKFLSIALAMLMLLSMFPAQVFAVSTAEDPWKNSSVNSNVFLDALKYTGYDTSKFVSNGNYGSVHGALSGIGYNAGGATGLETKNGKPDIDAFKKNGLCCGAYAAYVYFNYLPNVYGLDTSFLQRPSNPRSTTSWHTACEQWVASSNARKYDLNISTRKGSAGYEKLNKIRIGSILIFKDSNGYQHTGIYAGTKNGRYFQNNVGNDRGPEINIIDGFQKNGYLTLEAAYTPTPPEESGNIAVQKKDTNGKNLAGAVFVATNTSTNQKYNIGPTNTNGYAITKDYLPFGTYTVKETVFPTGYHAYGKTEWTVTLNGNSPNNTVTINAVNEIDKGSVKIVKTAEDGKIGGISFNIKGNGINKTVTTNQNGVIQIDNLTPGTYTVTEHNYDKYNPTTAQSVTVVSNKVATVTFNNTLKRGSLTVTKTSEDGFVNEVKFRLHGTSLSGLTVDQYAVTNANGIAEFKNVLIGTYTLEEIDTANRYVVPQAQNITIPWNNVANAKMHNALKRGTLTITKTAEDGLIEGKQFRLTGTALNGENVDLTAVTNANGVAEFKDVLIGSRYTVEEINTPNYYIVPENQLTAILWNEVTNLNFHNALKRGTLTVTKTAEDGLSEGLTFKLTGTSDSGIKVNETAKTNANGIAEFKNVLIGSNYELQEINTPIKYVIPNNQTTHINWNELTETQFNNTLKKWRLNLTKSDAEFGTAQGDGTLAGAEYGIYKGGQLIDTYRTDANGQFTTKYYVCGDDWTVREIAPSNGYLLDNKSYHIGAEAKLYTVELNSTDNSVYEQVIKGDISIIKHSDDGSTQIETPEKGAEFEIFLKSAGSYKKAKGTERDILVCDEYGFAQTKKLPYGVYTVHQTKGWEGREFIKDFDVFISKDGYTHRFLINNRNFESFVKIVKKDAETNKTIAYAGAGFQLYAPDGSLIKQSFTYPTPTTIDTFYTNQNGELVTPQKLPYGKGYKLVEVQAPYGYVLDSTPIIFDITPNSSATQDGIPVVEVSKPNPAQKGTIEITKLGEQLSSVTENNGIYTPVYEDKPLCGVVFEVYADEDITTLDGTVRAKKGSLVATITTDKNGVAKTPLLYLGKYLVKEKSTVNGFVLNTTEYAIELTYAGQNTSITSSSATISNERQKVAVTLQKALEKDNIFNIGNNNEILNVKFGLYAAENIKALDGKIIPKDSLICSASCTQDGTILFDCDLPIGYKFYVKEIATDDHYILSDVKYEFNTEYKGQDIDKYTVQVNKGEPITNNIIRGSIIGKKVCEDGYPICGAVFGLFRADETEFTNENALAISKSNEIGIFTFTNIPYGKYIVREIESPKGFILNEKLFPVTVSSNGEAVEIEVENKFITGKVTVNKVDANTGKPINGAVFEVYVDVNKNQKFDKDIDVLVGEMTEGKNGVHSLDGLRYGGYFVHEKTAPKGYIKDNNYYYFEINKNNEEVTVSNSDKGFANKIFTGELTIVKTDTEGNVLAGAGFQVKDLDGNIIAEGYTDENGIVKFLLPYGEYTVEEFKAPDGYELKDGKIKINVNKDGIKFKVTVTNERVSIPNTGVDTFVTYNISAIAIGFGLFLTLILIAIRKKAKIKN